MWEWSGPSRLVVDQSPLVAHVVGLQSSSLVLLLGIVAFLALVPLVASSLGAVAAYLAFALAAGKLAYLALLGQVAQSSAAVPPYSAAFVGSSSPSLPVVVCPS